MTTDNTLTYTMITERAKEAAQELTPDLPTKNTLEAWEEFLSELEDFDHSLINEEVENWDWSIYTHFGGKILHVRPQSEINEAEEQFLEYNHGMEVQELCGGFDIWSVQSQIAYHLLINLVTEEVNGLISELTDLAETTIDNLG